MEYKTQPGEEESVIMQTYSKYERYRTKANIGYVVGLGLMGAGAVLKSGILLGLGGIVSFGSLSAEVVMGRRREKALDEILARYTPNKAGSRVSQRT